MGIATKSSSRSTLGPSWLSACAPNLLTVPRTLRLESIRALATRHRFGRFAERGPPITKGLKLSSRRCISFSLFEAPVSVVCGTLRKSGTAASGAGRPPADKRCLPRISIIAIPRLSTIPTLCWYCLCGRAICGFSFMLGNTNDGSRLTAGLPSLVAGFSSAPAPLSAARPREVPVSSQVGPVGDSAGARRAASFAPASYDRRAFLRL